ncbi:DUF5694 domain-containing protein [uncultured Chitinophaga sp.]|jgi:Exonuclease VII, large subunit|uniref:DUF5694 domain-containing protein n=1 Tax=uncultured Chitinophaga sp. TaxID=339340 RepID=UPI00260B4CC8|nr:DUF5694 domain-containing protein [uncultured Chitinophaga sp.]
MKLLPFVLLVCFNAYVSAQTVDWKKLEQLRPDKVLTDPAAPPVKVLLLGSFHFGYPNLDQHKTDSTHMMDVLSDQRQREIRQLLDVLTVFKPTRIYVEQHSQAFVDSLYNAYLAGQHQLRRNEIDQLAFRLSKELQLPKVYAADASSFANEQYRKSPIIDSVRRDQQPVDTLRDNIMGQRYTRFYDEGDAAEVQNTILESFLLMADDEVLRRMHGAYLTSGFNTVGNGGPDLLAMWWYSRNLRIFNNILKTRPTVNDRIIVLFGNGHIPILKHCFSASPEFEVVELRELVRKAGVR